ncbi:unnamed protein product [Closterium sp. Yama58-4]|nr:unnamed protein product [Closterium sp. Yama58-4]
MQHAKKPATIFDDLAFVPEHDLLDASWLDNAHDLPSKAASKQGKPAWQVHLKHPPPASTDVAPSSLRNLSAPRDANLEGLLAAQLPPPGGAAGNAAGSAAALREEEMEAWFQYPLGEPIDGFGRLRAVEGLSVDDGGQGLEGWRADEISAVDLARGRAAAGSRASLAELAALSQPGAGADTGAHAAGLCGNSQAQQRAEPVGVSATMGGRGAGQMGGLNSMVAAAKPLCATSAAPAVSTAPVGAAGASSSAAAPLSGNAGIAGVSARLANKALAALKTGKLASPPASSAGDSNALAVATTEGVRDATAGTAATAAAGTAAGAAGAPAPGASKPPASLSNMPRPTSESNASAAAIAGASHGVVTGNCVPSARQSAACRPLPYAPLNVSRQQQLQQRQLRADARQPDQTQEPAGTAAERSPDAGHASTVTSTAPAGCGANGAHKAERAATGSSGMVRRAEEGSGGGSAGGSGGEGSAGGGTERTGQAERPARTASIGGTKDSWLPGASRGGARGGRKRGREEGEYARTEDLPEESLDTRRTGATGATGATSGAGRRSGLEGSAAKRARAAEVHNMSERRRRDRINERMKALQQLIPNSNKTDKASMLDEAIEYLRMLQLQLHVMSARTGIALPPALALPHPTPLSALPSGTPSADQLPAPGAALGGRAKLAPFAHPGRAAMEIQLAAAAVRALEAALKRKLEGEAVGDFNVDASAETSALLKRARGNPEGGAATQSGRPESGAAGRTDGVADLGDANNADANRAESSRRPAAGGSRSAARGGADDVMPTRSELEAIWQLVHSGYFAGGGEGELREGQGAHEAADLTGASGSRGEGSLPRAVGTAEVAAREGRAIRKAWEESLSAQGGGAGGGVGERGGRADEFAGGGGQQSSKKGQNLGPQAMAARMRRERVNARMRVLQGLVPGAATMTTESFLLEAVHYVRFLLQQVMELSELYTPQNRNREEGEGESGGEAGEGAGCSVEGGAGGKGDVDSELRREGLRLVRVDRLLPIVGPALFPPSVVVAISSLMAAVAASLAPLTSCAVPSRCGLKQRGSSARSAESKPLVHVSPINRLRCSWLDERGVLSHAISRSQSQSRRTSLTVRAAGESADTPATDTAGSKPTTPEAASAESPSASGVPCTFAIPDGEICEPELTSKLVVTLMLKRRTRDGDDGESDGEEGGKGRQGEEGGRERKERKEKERKGGRRERGERRRKRREKKRRSLSDDDASNSDWSSSSRDSSSSERENSSDADSDSSSDDRKKKRERRREKREKREKRGKEKEKRRRKEGGRENEQDGGSAEDQLERDLRRMMREFPLDVSHDLVRLLEHVDGGEAVDVGGIPDRRLKKLLGSIFHSLG